MSRVYETESGLAVVDNSIGAVIARNRNPYRPCPKRERPMSHADKAAWAEALRPVAHKAYLLIRAARQEIAKKQHFVDKRYNGPR